MSKKPMTKNGPKASAPGAPTHPSGTRAAAAKPPPIPGASLPAIPSAAPAPDLRAGAKTDKRGPATADGAPRPSLGVDRAVGIDRSALDTLAQSLSELKALVTTIAHEVDRVRASERGLSEDGESALADIALRLRGALGGPLRKGPPPIPSATPRAVTLSTLDISEMAELVESLAPPSLDDEWR